MGTNVKNFKKLFSSCNATRNSTSSVPLANSIYNCLVYNVGWLSANLTATDGPDNHVGSKRTIESGSAVGTYEFVEEVRRYKPEPFNTPFRRPFESLVLEFDEEHINKRRYNANVQ